MPFIHAFELIRIRMAIEMRHHSHRPSPWNAICTIWTEGRSSGSVTALPVLHFYRGFTVSVLGTVFYRGGIFLIWETLNAHSRNRLSAKTLCSHQTQIHLAVGAIAGTVAQVVTYPLEVVRHTQQASGAGSPERMIGFRETVVRVWMQAGWRGFFSGLGIGLIKQVPMHSISLAVWQIAKRVLEVFFLRSLYKTWLFNGRLLETTHNTVCTCQCLLVMMMLICCSFLKQRFIRKVKREPALASESESRTKMFLDPQDQDVCMDKRSEVDSTER